MQNCADLYTKTETTLTKASKWEEVTTLGKGSSGKVSLMKNRFTGNFIARKTLLRPFCDPHSQKRLLTEVSIMTGLKHPNTLRLFHVQQNKTTDEVHLWMEYANGGDLLQYVRRKGRLEEPEARRLFAQLLSAVEHAHKSHVVHRDIKAENVLLDENGNVKLGDWGFATWWKPGAYLSDFCGSVHYCAPELCMGREYVGPEVDVWSMGVLLYAMCSGTLPFGGTAPQLHERIKAAEYRAPFYFSPELTHLISLMLQPSSLKRATVLDIKKHPWLRGGFPTQATASVLLR